MWPWLMNGHIIGISLCQGENSTCPLLSEHCSLSNGVSMFTFPWYHYFWRGAHCHSTFIFFSIIAMAKIAKMVKKIPPFLPFSPTISRHYWHSRHQFSRHFSIVVNMAKRMKWFSPFAIFAIDFLPFCHSRHQFSHHFCHYGKNGENGEKIIYCTLPCYFTCTNSCLV